MSTFSRRAGKTMIVLAAGSCGLLALAYPEWRAEAQGQGYEVGCGPNITNPLEALVGTWAFSAQTFAAGAQPFVFAARFEASMGTQDHRQDPEVNRSANRNDGNDHREGVLSVTQTLNDNGEVISQERESGTYEVFEDCSGGILTFNTSSGPISFDFLFGSEIGRLTGVSTSSRFILWGGGERSSNQDCVERCNIADDNCPLDDAGCAREYNRCINDCRCFPRCGVGLFARDFFNVSPF